MKDKELTLTIEIFKEGNNTIAWISTENTTGEEYYVEDAGEVGDAVKHYLETYC